MSNKGATTGGVGSVSDDSAAVLPEGSDVSSHAPAPVSGSTDPDEGSFLGQVRDESVFGSGPMRQLSQLSSTSEVSEGVTSMSSGKDDVCGRRSPASRPTSELSQLLFSPHQLGSSGGFVPVSPSSRQSAVSQVPQHSDLVTSVSGSPRGEDSDLYSRPTSIHQSPQLSVRSGSIGSSGSYRLGGHSKLTPNIGRHVPGVSPTSSKEAVSEARTPPTEGHQPLLVQLSSGKRAELSHVSDQEHRKSIADSRLSRGRDKNVSESLSAVKEDGEAIYPQMSRVGWHSLDTEDNDDTFYHGLNPMYATVTSNASAFSRESSDMAYIPNFPGGVLHFVQEGDSVFNQMDRYYVCIPRDSTVDDVASYIAGGWRRRTPKIVLSVISSVQYFKAWENERSVDNFKRGLIQAANLTEMWILTDGLDRGVAKMIGNAVYQEMARRKCQEMDAQVVKNVYMVEKVTKLTVLGVVNKEHIAYSEALSGEHKDPQELENSGYKPSSGKYNLNPNHTHFILGEEVTSQELINFRYNLELRFQMPVGRPRRYRRMPSSQTTLFAGNSEVDLVQTHMPTVEGTTTPVIGLLIQGGPPDIDHTLALLKKKIPVIVMKGFGLAADLIAFAYQEMKERSDDDHVNMFVKPELMKKVKDAFPKDFKDDDLARNECRDKILECAIMAHQDSLTYLTILDTSSKESDLTHLNKYILKALFKAQTRKLGTRWREQIQRDLQLTLDWNRPDLANTEIFKKYNWINIKVEDHVFHQALIRTGREEFVELFLNKGFRVHRYLHHKRLHNLFENAQDKEFFIGVCLEGVLGKSVDPYAPLDREFVETESCDLNRLIYRCTRLSKLVNPYTLSMNALGSYITDKDVAERRAVNTLVFWAALTNRPKLAKVFWRKTEDPMAMALIISMLMHNLAKRWCKEPDIRYSVKNTAIEFGKMAVSLLDLCYKDSTNQAFQALNKTLQDFNDKTVVEIARMGKNKWFIAHPCCQKWLSRRWYGNLHIRELDWGQPTLPDWLKIYLSVFLVFPMYVWVYFEPEEKGKQKFETDDDEEEVEIAEDTMLLRPTSMDLGVKRKKSVVKQKLHSLIARGNLGIKLPLWKQIFYLWSAPITKFWINQLFYVFFLVLFSVAVLWPSCGNVYLNSVVFIWTVIIWAELVRATLVKKAKYPEVPIFWKTIEIILIMVFMLMFPIFRILPHFFPYVDYMTTKFIMSIGLLLFYYRTLAVFLPMSPTLGPMLISINKMVRKDFMTWMRMFLIVMVAGGITIHAVLYPSYPLTQEGIKKALARAFFAMFLTKIDDLEGDEDCNNLYRNKTIEHCSVSSSTSGTASDQLNRCPYSSLGGYAIVIQYLLITKLVLITLLYAMFSDTNARISNEAEEIWKYQRYTIIVDFDERLRLPPPLTLISYMCMFLSLVWRKLKQLYYRCRSCCKCVKKDMKDGMKKVQIMKVRRTVDFNYWKSCLQTFNTEEEQELIERHRNKEQSDSLSRLIDDMELQKDNHRRMNNRVVHVEKNVTVCRLLLEEMKHMIQNLDPKSQGLKPVQQLVHVSARQSPYPGTRTQRFPVFDKYVAWEVVYEAYDPTYMTRPLEDFNEEYAPFVDPDIMELRHEEQSRQKMSPEEVEKLSPLPEFTPMWNTVFIEKVDDVSVDLDRTSWITFDNQPLRYKLDTTDLPQNPLGRTGIRGRGKLWRWGPNHRIAAVVTRWKRKYSPLGYPLDHIVVEGKRVLEFIVVPRPDTGELTLPGGNVYGMTTSYGVMCEEFMKGVLNTEDAEECQRFGEEDMINFFAEFAMSTSSETLYKLSQMNAAAKGFSAQILYRGYIDDPSNTDNAWREAEVWNFHYQLSDTLDDRIPVRENAWREISPYTRLYGNQDSIVKEAARIHDSYF
ncbi:transient receptor potential cation channel subfamily M member-like 2 [Haliotis rufescens]|uniref:transient receptor potential cation channel subfamily M member-like 2 n=1 Tax=Haliotis rufescens TaxID=6454 RepID=UPI00201EEA19|nr:transient receptor potential cation channel subfamily M member-like 2 [Haliotis rufescens]